VGAGRNKNQEQCIATCTYIQKVYTLKQSPIFKDPQNTTWFVRMFVYREMEMRINGGIQINKTGEESCLDQ
jgi:hypothetical protein